MSPALFDDLDAPAYTRALTSLTDFQRSQALRAAARDVADNRSFNRRFWATLASETGGVPGGIGTGWWSDGVWGIVGRLPGDARIPEDPEFLRHRW